MNGRAMIGAESRGGECTDRPMREHSAWQQRSVRYERYGIERRIPRRRHVFWPRLSTFFSSSPLLLPSSSSSSPPSRFIFFLSKPKSPSPPPFSHPPWQPLQTLSICPNNPFNVSLLSKRTKTLPACDSKLRSSPQCVRCPLHSTPSFGSKFLVRSFTSLIYPSLYSSLMICSMLPRIERLAILAVVDQSTNRDPSCP